jgi:hypothetical protein
MKRVPHQSLLHACQAGAITLAHFALRRGGERALAVRVNLILLQCYPQRFRDQDVGAASLATVGLEMVLASSSGDHPRQVRQPRCRSMYRGSPRPVPKSFDGTCVVGARGRGTWTAVVDRGAAQTGLSACSSTFALFPAELAL